MKQLLTVREAKAGDVPAIAALLAIYAAQQIVLARDENDIRANLGSFVVGEIAGGVRGCAAVRDFGGDLLEVRSLAVAPEFKGKGVGRAMVEAIVSGLEISRKKLRLFALTYQPGFFFKLGFQLADREQFPEKIWSDCSKCPKKQHCDEIAVLLEH